MNLLYIDTEFSSFYSSDKKKSGELLQLSIVPVVNGVIQKPFNEYCRPLGRVWNMYAEKVHKIGQRRAATFQHPSELAKKLLEFISQYDVVFTCAGWSCKGDQQYIERLIGDYEVTIDFYKRVRMKWRDVKDRAKSRKKHFPVKDYKLKTVADYFGIEINAHDALSDADVTRQVDDRLSTINITKEAIQADACNLTNVEKKAKYRHSRYAQIGNKSVFISELATDNPEAMRYIIEDLWETFVEGR